MSLASAKDWLGSGLTSLLIVVALIVAAVGPAFAQQKKKTSCISGETAAIVSYKVEKGENLPAAIPKPLNGKRGNPKKGIEWMVDRRQGNCIACHEVTKIKEKIKDGDLDALQKYGFHGNVAPTLDGVAERYNEAELRMIVVDAKMAFPDFDTSMPAYHRTQGLERVLGDCDGLVILPAERVEDIVAFLTTLKD